MSTTLVIAILLLAIGVIGLVVIVRMVLSFSSKDEVPGLSRNDFAARWGKIEQLVGAGDEMSNKLALMEADKLFDHVLKSMMFAGETMGERMKVAGYKYSKISEVWPAHILRNKMVHDAYFSLRPDSARRAVGQYKAALKQMNVL